MNYAGAMLAGYIATVAEGAQGFVGASPYDPSAKTFTIKMQSATTKELANRIVSQNGKGVWVFRPAPEGRPHPRIYTPVRVYAYDDNALDLKRLTCEHGN